MDSEPVPNQWSRTSSRQAIHDYLPQLQTGAPQTYERAPQQTTHTLRQRIDSDVHKQREASANATSHNENLAKHCEVLLAELEMKMAELSSLRGMCQQQGILAKQQTSRADANESSANAWKQKADDLEAAIERKRLDWDEEKKAIDQQNQSNINDLNKTHVEERDDLKKAADNATAKVDELLLDQKQQADRTNELERVIHSQSADLASSLAEWKTENERANKAHQELLKLREVNKDQDTQITQLEKSRHHFAACLLLQGVRCAHTNRILFNTAGRLISRTWELGKTRRQLQQSEKNAEAERQGYVQASAEYNAEKKLRKHWQNQHENECVAHRDSIKKLHDAQAQAKMEESRFQQEHALQEGLSETLAERTRQFNEKSAKCTTLLNELESCKLQLSASKRTQEQESKRAREAEENAVIHLNARKEAEKERDGLKAKMDTIESVFYGRQQDGKAGPLTKQQEDTTSTTTHDAPKAIDKISERLTDNEGRNVVRKDSHSPERNAAGIHSSSNDSNKKRQADGKLPSVPKKRRTYNDSTSREHDIYRPPM